MLIDPRSKHKLSDYDIPDAKEKAAQIFCALHGIEIDTAIALLDWCSRKLLQQKCAINPVFLQEACE